MSGLINKVKDALHSDKDKTHHEQPEGTHGTHNSRAANAADPRIDSDRDHRANPTSTTTGGLGGSSAHTGPTAGGLGHNTGTGHTAGGLGQSTGAGHTAGGLGGSSHTAGGLGHNTGAGHTAGGLGQSTGAGHTAGGLGSTGGIGHRSENFPEGTVGPHSSRAANAADPRVDSDLDSSRSHGAGAGLGSHSTNTGGIHSGSTGLPGSTHAGGIHSGNTAGGFGSATGTGHRSENLPGSTHSSGLHGSNNSGLPGATHSSGLHEGSGAGIGSHTGGLNAGHNAGGLNTYDQTTTGTSGLSSHGAGAHGPNAGLTGSHGPNSGLSGTHGSNAGLTGGRDAGAAYGSGPGPAENTAGPHKSDLLNKADPRVDSNLDGSKTVGKEKTFDQSGTNFAGRDPTDAAQVPPSVLQKHVPSEIAHDDPSSDHGRRHSSVNKEHHTGL
ncbi:Ff.00g072170.m01.CDS01 [Fusarium sp. VM40]|nr:Ff.00g072170.m01.CDS01 [Fusarium sp. VM40]